jgi:hypothetical protein
MIWVRSAKPYCLRVWVLLRRVRRKQCIAIDECLRHNVLVWPIDEEGEGVGINRWSDIEERKGKETDAKAGDELPAEGKGDASSRLQASEGPKENEEKREVVKKLKERES